MLQVPSDLGHYLWKIPDRRSMVVLPFLDPRLYLRRIWILFRQRDSPVADIRIVCHYHAFHLRSKLPTIIINKTGKNPYAARMQLC